MFRTSPVEIPIKREVRKVSPRPKVWRGGRRKIGKSHFAGPLSRNRASWRHDARDRKDAPVIVLCRGEDRMGPSKPEVLKKIFFSKVVSTEKSETFSPKWPRFFYLSFDQILAT